MIKPFNRGFYHTFLIHSFPTMVPMLKTEPITDGYISWSSSGIHWLRSTWHPRGSTSHKLFPSSFLHNGIPFIELSHEWTHSFPPMSTVEGFGASVLHASLLSTHKTAWSFKSMKSRKLTTWLYPSDCLISVPYYIQNPTEFRSPRLPDSQPLDQLHWLGRHIPGTKT